MLTSIYALGLLLVSTLIAIGVGWKTLNYLKLDGLEGLELYIYGQALGLGLLAYGVLLLSLLGWVNSWAILIWLVLVGIWVWREILQSIRILVGYLSRSRRRRPGLQFEIKLIGFILSFILLLSLLQALAPPWDYDGLLYHLEGPRQFLVDGGFTAETENWLNFLSVYN